MLTHDALPDEFLELLNKVTGKRARIVVEHILEHGFITTEDLEEKYGYNHPPRAVRDVREQGIPIETFSAKSKQGRSIAAYRFGNPSEAIHGVVGGRQTLPKATKQSLYELQNGKCAVCLETFDERYLQVDHRIPFQVSGEPENLDNADNFMLLCGSCNRAKSWSCENCENALLHKNPDSCQNCYWGNPLTYVHIALRPIRQARITWSGTEVQDYESLRQVAQDEDNNLPAYVKEVLKRHLVSMLGDSNDEGQN